MSTVVAAIATMVAATLLRGVTLQHVSARLQPVNVALLLCV